MFSTGARKFWISKSIKKGTVFADTEKVYFWYSIENFLIQYRKFFDTVSQILRYLINLRLRRALPLCNFIYVYFNLFYSILFIFFFVIYICTFICTIFRRARIKIRHELFSILCGESSSSGLPYLCHRWVGNWRWLPLLE